MTTKITANLEKMPAGTDKVLTTNNNKVTIALTIVSQDIRNFYIIIYIIYQAYTSKVI